jgi:hypothetical protein
VIGWTAAEAAALLEGSAVSINSALQRARATLANHYPSGRPSVALKPTPAQQRLAVIVAGAGSTGGILAVCFGQLRKLFRFQQTKED